MSTPVIVLLAVVVLLACVQLGGGMYEFLVLDPVWPNRPAIIQPHNGGVSRRRFWLPALAAFDVLLIVALLSTWSHSHVRTALLVAVASHGTIRVWSWIDLTPKAVAFEKADPATIDRRSAVGWTRRSLIRLLVGCVTCAAAVIALIAAS